MHFLLKSIDFQNMKTGKPKLEKNGQNLGFAKGIALSQSDRLATKKYQNFGIISRLIKADKISIFCYNKYICSILFFYIFYIFSSDQHKCHFSHKPRKSQDEHNNKYRMN
jgi:hypothetical protein